MAPPNSPPPSDDFEEQPPIPCPACESAFSSNGRPSFLLLDQLTVPLVGCDDHLSHFADVCSYTSERTAELIDHRPAGGVRCPSCHLAANDLQHPVIPVQDGAVAVLACSDHQSELIERFHTGLDTQHQLSTTIDTP